LRVFGFRSIGVARLREREHRQRDCESPGADEQRITLRWDSVPDGEFLTDANQIAPAFSIPFSNAESLLSSVPLIRSNSIAFRTNGARFREFVFDAIGAVLAHSVFRAFISAFVLWGLAPNRRRKESAAGF
jgi:hypothetical protein